MFTDPSPSLTLILTLNHRRCLNRPSPLTRWLVSPPPQRHDEPEISYVLGTDQICVFSWPGVVFRSIKQDKFPAQDGYQTYFSCPQQDFSIKFFLGFFRYSFTEKIA